MQTYDTKTAYQALFEYSNIGMVISNQDGTIVQVNPYASQLFGYDASELVGQKIEVMVPMKVREKHVGLRVDYTRHPEPRAMGIGRDLLALKKNGTEFPVEISLAPYETDGKRYIVSFINDITLRKTAEEALKKLNSALEEKVGERTKELSQALLELGEIHANLQTEMEYRKKIETEVRRALETEKELSELKSRFVSMASHEFRTPLGGISTSASLIEKYQRPEDEQKRTKHVQTIKKSVQHLTNILNDFLSLDKLEQGKIECRPSRFNLVEFAQNLLSDMRDLSEGGSGIVYEHRGENDAVVLDKEMLRNVVINLLSNAMKYSPTGEEIRLMTEITDSHLILHVEDRGIGIPEEEQRHLFGRFFRATNATTIPGTGLGLTIVKRYLELMGGTIDFTSKQNEGTTFMMTLPREIA